MLDSLYGLFASLGYPHPVHPPQVEIPLGMVTGSLVFAVAAALFRRESLLRTAHHCMVFALAWLFPTVLTGVLDWLHFLHGEWSPAIRVKIALTPVLLALMVLAVLLARRPGAKSRSLLAVYALVLGTAGVMGYFGGQLVFGAPAARSHEAGRAVFARDCQGCHPQGGNIMEPGKPLKGAPQLSDFATFLAYLRRSSGSMPAFPADRLPDHDAEELYRYARDVLHKK